MPVRPAIAGVLGVLAALTFSAGISDAVANPARFGQTWQLTADFTSLAYHSPVAVLPLLLIAPVTLLAANLLAAWPGHRAARLRPGRILREE